MNLLVCNAQVPFMRGGAEALAEGLVSALRAAGHRADLVALPFQWQPKSALLTSALAWRLLSLEESNGVRVDRVIATKFPSYAVKHPHKVVWLVHQLRQAYDWYGTPLSDFTGTPEDLRVRAQVRELDRRMLAEAQARFAISKNVAGRLARYNGLDAEPLYPPPRLSGQFRSADSEGFILYVGRLDRAKRVDLLLRSLKEANDIRAVIVGEGPEAEALARLAHSLEIENRVRFAGRADDETLLDLYSRAAAVYYAPVDEDYGYVTVEAFLSDRPVVTTTDAGGVLEFVGHEENGLVVAPEPAEIGRALARIVVEPRAREWGRAGHARVRDISWAYVVERLTA